MELTEILREPRQTSGDYHAAAGMAWRRYGEKDSLHSPLAYSAFEFRLAIERYVFEVYYLVLRDKLISAGDLPDEDLGKIDSFSNLIRLLHENAGNKLRLRRAFIFNRVFARVFTPLLQRLSIPDIGKFHKYWQQLSNYCHRQLQPEITWESEDWIKKGYKLLNEVESYLWEVSVKEGYGWVSKSSLTSNLQEERERFINDPKITEEQLELRMKLIKPALEFRRGIQIDILFQNNKFTT